MDYLSKNLNFLSDRFGIESLYKISHCGLDLLNSYISGGVEPPIKFLTAIKENYGISIDDLLFSDISENFDVSDDFDLGRFYGNYICYYYSNAVNDSSSADLKSLNYGVMSIVNKNNKPKVYCTFSKDKQASVELLETLSKCTTDEIIEQHSKATDKYIGDFKFTTENIFITLCCEDRNDYSYLIFKNPPKNKTYIGGVATANTVSRGTEHNPCIQYFIISRYKINRPDGDLYNFLNLDKSDVSLKQFAGELTKIVTTLYNNSNELSYLPLEQKKLIIESMLKYNYDNLIEKNEFRFGKISNSTDDKFYRIIKNEG